MTDAFILRWTTSPAPLVVRSTVRWPFVASTWQGPSGARF